MSLEYLVEVTEDTRNLIQNYVNDLVQLDQ